jgi:hypothetical protein
MTLHHNVMFVYLDEHATAEAQEQHLNELAAAIDSRGDSAPMGVLYEQNAVLLADARQRARVAELFRRRRIALARTTAGFALATPSPLVRGVLRALFWLEPPPYPWAVAATPLAGLEVLRRHMPALDPLTALRAYETAKARLIGNHRRGPVRRAS